MGPPPVWEPWRLFTLAFLLSFLASLAKQLRTAPKVKMARAFWSAFYAGSFGSGFAMVSHKKYDDDPWVLLGLCILIGLGGDSARAMVMMVIKSMYKGLGDALDATKDKSDPDRPIKPPKGPPPDSTLAP